MFAAAARRYVDAHFGPRTNSAARFIALAGDAELDEGNVWEAIADPALQGLGNVMWVVDTNRQSLDRVIPDQKIKKLMALFDGAGWHVVEAKYGHRLTAAFDRPGGDALRRHIDDMSNEEYQSLFAHHGADLREKFLAGAGESAALRGLLDDYSDEEIAPLVQNLGGHDLRLLIEAYRACDAVTDRPSVVFAYTVKGWGLPIAGDPLNHAALLSAEQIGELRVSLGLTEENEWDRFERGSAEGEACRATGSELNNTPPPPRPVLAIPNAVGVPAARATSTQETFGRILTRLGELDGVGQRMMTTSPDVSVSTNLGGWINKMGVFAAEDRPDYLGEERLLRWKQAPAGHHIELGISEMNLFLLLQAFGLGHDLHGEHLLPIGTVYDPFVCRGLDALIYALYSGARFVVVGTPAGITLAPEGGAHQSTITPSIGLELPGLTFAEPAFAQALDWLLCDGLARLGAADGTSLYLRLSTRPVDQGPFRAASDRLGEDRLRADVLAGGYRLREPAGSAGIVARDVWAGRARGARRGGCARRRRRTRARARPHQHRPAVPRVAVRVARLGARSAADGRQSSSRRADRSGGTVKPHRDGPRRRQPPPGVARRRLRSARRSRRGRRVRTVGQHPRVVRRVRPVARTDRQRRPRRNRGACDQTQAFVSVPSPSIVVRTTSPGRRNFPCGRPTPAGVPVKIRSPGYKVRTEDR